MRDAVKMIDQPGSQCRTGQHKEARQMSRLQSPKRFRYVERTDQKRAQRQRVNDCEDGCRIVGEQLHDRADKRGKRRTRKLRRIEWPSDKAIPPQEIPSNHHLFDIPMDEGKCAAPNVENEDAGDDPKNRMCPKDAEAASFENRRTGWLRGRRKLWRKNAFARLHDTHSRESRFLAR